MVERTLGGLMSVLQKALGLALIIAVLLNFANVITRYLFGYSILWADEVELFILVLITFLGAVIVGWHRAHLSMDVIRNKLPARARSALAVIETVVLIMVASLLCTQSYVYASQMMMLGRTSDNAGIPMWIPHSSVAVGFALLGAVSIWQAYARLRGLKLPASAMLDSDAVETTQVAERTSR